VDEARIPRLVAFGGLVMAAASAGLAAVAGSPYLSASHVNGWIVVYAAALFAALFAIPFMLERRLRERVEDRDDRWERALLIWGAATLGVLAVGLLLGLNGSFAGGSWAGSVGLIATIEAGLVLGCLGAWMLSN
jgi:hypothetical protein